MRKQKPEHPPWMSNVQDCFAQGLGHKVKCTEHRNMPTYAAIKGASSFAWRVGTALDKKKKHPSRQHRYQNLTLSTGKCKHGNNRFMWCEECSIMEGKDVYFYNTQKVGHREDGTGQRNTCLCYVAHHTKYHHNVKHKIVPMYYCCHHIIYVRKSYVRVR